MVGGMKTPCARWLAGLATAAIVALAQAQGGLRPEVGRPLQAAQEMIKSGRYREALAKVRDAEAVGGKTAAETTMIERMRLAAASGAGDADTAARAFDALGGSAGPDRLRMIESIAGSYYRAKEYAKAQQWYARYFKEGGTNGANRTLMMQTQYLSGDRAGVTRELTSEIQAAERNGATPPEDRINLLMNAAVKQKDVNAETFALERLVTYYPKKEYWATLLNRLQSKPGFAGRLALDTSRLSLATGSLTSGSDYSEMAQLALQAGAYAEARQVVDKGFAVGALGTGPQAERDKRLRDLVTKRVAEAKASAADDMKQALVARDGNDLLTIGFNQVFEGDKAKGLQTMQQAIAKGGLTRPEDAKLHLAIAQLAAGENAKAQVTLKTVGGTDGTADLARLWTLFAKRGKLS